MDSSLIVWAKAVKRRSGLPPLWYVTDAARAADPLSVMARLPPGLCGVLFRHDGVPGRAALAMRVARLCRARRLALVMTGAPGVNAGVHWRGGARGGRRRAGARLASASAHDARELARARRAKADLVFISPLCPTASHPGAKALGVRKWRALAGRAGRVKPFALGGIAHARQVRGLGPACAGIAAIGAFHAGKARHFAADLPPGSAVQSPVKSLSK